MLLTLLTVHAAAFAAVLMLSRRDVVLVDEAGSPVDRAGAWVAQTVPAAAADRVAV